MAASTEDGRARDPGSSTGPIVPALVDICGAGARSRSRSGIAHRQKGAGGTPDTFPPHTNRLPRCRRRCRCRKPGFCLRIDNRAQPRRPAGRGYACCLEKPDRPSPKPPSSFAVSKYRSEKKTWRRRLYSIRIRHKIEQCLLSILYLAGQTIRMRHARLPAR